MENMTMPFRNTYNQYDVIKNMGGHSTTSPAVAAVKRLQKEAGIDNPSKTPISEKDTYAMSSMALTRNPDMVYDIQGRQEMREQFDKPSKFVNGYHISEIREQAKLLRQYEKVSQSKPSFVTPVGIMKEKKVLARSYRNDLDVKYTNQLMTPDDDQKPSYDWVKGIRKQVLMQMKNADIEKKKNLVKLTKILTHQHPNDIFTELKNVYEDSDELKLDQNDMIDAMLCYI